MSPPPFVAGHPAQAVLAHFSGLHVDAVGTGEDAAAGDIDFGFHSHDQSATVIGQWEHLLSTRLVNIGETHDCHCAMFMDSTGACYQLSLVHDLFAFEGSTFGEAIERLLLGRRSKPMLRPEQASVMMYGMKVTRGHPTVHWAGIPG